jgi:hypothetical protein
MGFLIDAAVVLLIAGMTYAVSAEGVWGAALMFFNVLFGGVIAFNFYEPLAKLLADAVPFIAGYTDMLCLFALFIVATFLLRLATDSLAPSLIRYPAALDQPGRFVFALGASAMLIAILLLALHAGPLHRKIFGVIDYKSKTPFGLGLDRRWLALFQHTTGQVFTTTSTERDPFGQYDYTKVFDPRAEWLLNHQEARPFGEETVLSEEGGGGGAAGGAAAPADAQAAPPGGAPAPPPGGAGGSANSADPKIVGPAVGGGVVLPQ